MIEVVAATQVGPRNFANRPLGVSLDRLNFDKRISREIAFSNSEGLPLIYNRRIRARSEADILLFVHDDVWIDDYFIADRTIDALSCYDVIGVAGNRRVPDAHVAWCFVNDQFEWDEASNLSGSVAHGAGPFGEISHYGATPGACELLDGVLLIARRSVLLKAAVEFDTLFTFNFYDLDFCRSARAAGLRVGTWPIAITHASDGGGGRYGYGTPEWEAALSKYRANWV